MLDQVLSLIDRYPTLALGVLSGLATLVFWLMPRIEARYPRLQALFDLVRALGFNLTGALAASQRLVNGRARRDVVLPPAAVAALEHAVAVVAASTDAPPAEAPKVSP
jgi:hypothetical protein